MKLLQNVNKQKDKLKKMGITVDGKRYRIQFRGNYNTNGKRLAVFCFLYFSLVDYDISSIIDITDQFLLPLFVLPPYVKSKK